MHQPFFSVIITGYQTAQYLPECIQSVQKQLCGDFECMIVVEESKDNSLQIAQDAAAKDTRFKAISLPVSGSAAAPRNYGIDHATGQYVVFLDGDDWLENNCLALCRQTIETYGDIDVVQYALHKIYQQPDGTYKDTGEIHAELPASLGYKLMTGREMIRAIGTHGNVYGYSVINCCRTEFLQKYAIYQRVGVTLEDFEWVWRVWYPAQKFVFIPQPLYIYRRTCASITSVKSPRFLFDTVTQFSQVPKFIQQYHVDLECQRVIASKWLNGIIGGFFHPYNDRRITNADRIKARKMLYSPENIEIIKRFTKLATLPKRVGMTLFSISRYIGLWLPMLYFRVVYYPLVKYRAKS